MPIGEHGDHVTVFWDVKSLCEGKQFASSFMHAMVQSLVVTPLIIPHALHRMMQQKGLNHQDNVLLEWMLALMLAKLDGYPVVRVMPIFSGSVSRGKGRRKACSGGGSRGCAALSCCCVMLRRAALSLPLRSLLYPVWLT